MKYRIKMVKYASGREEYHPQQRTLGIWRPIYEGFCMEPYPVIKSTFEEAKECILHEMKSSADRTVIHTEIVFTTEE